MPIIGPEIAHFQHGISRKTAGGDFFANTSNNTLGFVNTFSMSVWFKPSNIGASDRVLEIKPSASNNNRILIQFNTGDGDLNVVLHNLSGTIFKNYVWTQLCPAANWYNIIITWDGTTLLLYKNGVATTANTLTTDNAGTLVSVGRQLAFGASPTAANIMTGFLHSLAIWNVVVTAAEAARLYNNGNGAAFDVRNVQRANLMHWWLCDRGDTTNGKDYGFGNLLDISTNGTFGSLFAGPVSDAPRQLIQTTAYPGHKFCLDFDGSTENMRSQSSAIRPIGIANIWTTMMWIKPMESTFASNRVIWMLGANSTASGICFNHQGAVANDPLQVQLFRSDTSVFKQYLWNNLINAGQAWQQICVTWDGTTLLLYSNGVAVTPDTLTTDLTGTQADSNRQISVAANPGGSSLWLGRMHSCAVWGAVLTAGQISNLYNGGSGWNYDIRLTGGPKPTHWWLLGDPYYGLSYDRTDSSPGLLIDLAGGAAVNLSIADDSIRDAPGI